MRRALLLAVLATAVVAAPAHGGAHDATAPIAIPISGQTSPYPVNLAVFGEPGPITDVNVTLFDVSHSNPDDLDIGIRSPAGTFVVLTSDACGVGDVVNRTWTFDDEAAAPVQDAGSCNTSPASYEPEDYEADTWPGGTPPEAGDDLSLFDGQNPMGRWSLYVFDDAGSNGGDIGGGFRVTIAIGASQIAIPGGAASMGPAAPFPAVQDVATPGIITDLDVLLEGVTHRLPADVEVVLEGPRGQTVGLLADACSAASVANREWVIDDEVTGTFLSPCTSGSYRPAGAAQSLPAPAPGAPYGTSLSAFDLTDADGAWKLWVNDDALDNAGYVIDGYTLQMQTRPGATVGFDGDVGAFEGTVAQLLVTRGGASPLGEGTVRVQTQDATAQAGSDYTAVDQTLTFASGEVQKTVEVPIAADGGGEPRESFNVLLSSPDGDAALGSRPAAVVSISVDPVTDPPARIVPPVPLPPAAFTNASAGTLSSSRRCRRRGSRIRFRAKAPPGVQVTRTELLVNGRRVANLTGPRALDLVRVRIRRARTRVVARVHAADGRVVTFRRTFRRCPRKRRG